VLLADLGDSKANSTGGFEMFKKKAYQPGLSDQIADLGLVLTWAALVLSIAYLVFGGAYTVKAATDTDVFPGMDMLPDAEIQRVLQ